MHTGSEAHIKTLISVCRAEITGSPIIEESALPGLDSEWSGVVACASRHALLGLLYRAVGNRVRISPSALLPLRAAAHVRIARTCDLVQELLEIFSDFDAIELPALAMKGPTLAAHAYGRISDREFCDLDILVQPADLDRAALVLDARGYRTDDKRRSLQDLSRKGQNHFVFVRATDSAKVELHWSLNSHFERTPIESTGVWSRAQRVRLWNQSVPSLAIEDTLLFLCVHGFKHRWWRLNWLIDIAFIMRRADHIQWEALISRARRTGCCRMLLVGISLASDLLGSPNPPQIAKLMQSDRSVLWMVEQTRSILLSGTKFNSLGTMLYELHARERFRDHFIVVWRVLSRICRLTSEDGVSDSHSPGENLASLFTRPRRLYKTYGLAWLKPLLRLPDCVNIRGSDRCVKE